MIAYGGETNELCLIGFKCLHFCCQFPPCNIFWVNVMLVRQMFQTLYLVLSVNVRQISTLEMHVFKSNVYSVNVRQIYTLEM